MKAVKYLSLAFALVLVLTADGRAQGGRQYYSRYWQRKGGYYYRTYYYRPKATGSYRSHRVIYYPSRPRYYYYYNPYTRKYWGRYDRVAKGYSRLRPGDQSGRLADLEEANVFPSPGKMPEVPESKDGTQMAEPSDDLPPDESDTLGKGKMKDLMGGKEPPRQTYSGWCKPEGKRYYYCCYYCQPMSGGNYASHRCIYYPSQPRYIYYYNPARGSRKYWGRYDLQARGYSLLADKDKKGTLADIANEAFPKPAAMPPIPGSKDGTRMAVPPRNLPE